jgi:hypothetical protein
MRITDGTTKIDLNYFNNYKKHLVLSLKKIISIFRQFYISVLKLLIIFPIFPVYKRNQHKIQVAWSNIHLNELKPII